jgi:hypothetical protein
MSRIDRKKIKISEKGFHFEPFQPTVEHGIAQAIAKLTDEIELIAFEHGGQRRAVLLSQAKCHHIMRTELC